MRRPLLLIVALAGAIIATLKRRKAHDSAALWREATSDTSR